MPFNSSIFCLTLFSSTIRFRLVLLPPPAQLHFPILTPIPSLSFLHEQYRHCTFVPDVVFLSSFAQWSHNDHCVMVRQSLSVFSFKNLYLISLQQKIVNTFCRWLQIMK
jgi:hypothetical protein